jgi:hypothetical protein
MFRCAPVDYDALREKYPHSLLRISTVHQQQQHGTALLEDKSCVKRAESRRKTTHWNEDWRSNTHVSQPSDRSVFSLLCVWPWLFSINSPRYLWQQQWKTEDDAPMGILPGKLGDGLHWVCNCKISTSHLDLDALTRTTLRKKQQRFVGHIAGCHWYPMWSHQDPKLANCSMAMAMSPTNPLLDFHGILVRVIHQLK